MSTLDSLEKKLNEIFVKQMPALPSGFKKWVVTYLPWINLVLGVIVLLVALGLWGLANETNEVVDTLNEYGQVYGYPAQAEGVGLLVWASLAILAIEAILYIAAFPGTRDRKKSGWNLLFYALLINVAYGFVAMFTAYRGVSDFILTIIGSAIGGYFLFQIRSSYTKTAPKRKVSSKK